MQKREIEIGETYVAKVSGLMTVVRIKSTSPHGGWVGVNVRTGREIPIKTAARLRRPATPSSGPDLACEW